MYMTTTLGLNSPIISLYFLCLLLYLTFFGHHDLALPFVDIFEYFLYIIMDRTGDFIFVTCMTGLEPKRRIFLSPETSLPTKFQSRFYTFHSERVSYYRCTVLISLRPDFVKSNQLVPFSTCSFSYYYYLISYNLFF